MKSIVISFAYLILSNTTGAQTAQMVKEAQSIQTVLTDMAKAWNIYDTNKFSILFSEDADFTDTRGITAHGIKEIEKSYEKLIAGWTKNSSLKITDSKIRFITVDISTVDAWWEISGTERPNEKGIALRKGLFNLLMTRGDDKWYITVMHDMNLPVTE
jgi:uncharacterized protein (TIGR02246 family)